ncbi:MAG: hypothetical protein AB7N54_01695 [Alphaproteobacteria bacterium]
MRLLHFAGRHGTWVAASGIAIGYFVPALSDALGSVLLPMLCAMLGLSIARTDWTRLAGLVRRPQAALLQTAWLLLLAPLATLAVVSVLPLPPRLAEAIVLFAAIGPMTATPGLALLFGIDAAMALAGLVLCSLLAPLTMPTVALVLLGIEIPIAPEVLGLRLAGVVAVALAIGAIVRWLAGVERLMRARVELDGAFSIVFGIVAIAVMAGTRARTEADPAGMALIVAVACAVYLAWLVAGTVLFLPAGRDVALAVGLNTAARNYALLFAVLGAAATPEIASMAAAVQLPMYLLPLIQRPLYRRLLPPPPA